MRKHKKKREPFICNGFTKKFKTANGSIKRASPQNAQRQLMMSPTWAGVNKHHVILMHIYESEKLGQYINIHEEIKSSSLMITNILTI